MPDYSKGKIYRIVCNETGEQYIGSTTQTLAHRLAKHRNNAKIPNQQCSSKQIIERGNYAIVLIEECQCENKEQLERRERHFIETLDCVNRYVPTRTRKEYCRDNYEMIAEKRRKYEADNRQRLRERQRLYRLNNKEKTDEYQRTYVEANRDWINENQRKNYAKRAAKKLEKTHDGDKGT